MPNFPITDTHLHLWDPQKFNYDWIKDIEPLNRAFHLSDYNQHCQPIDVGAMVFVLGLWFFSIGLLGELFIKASGTSEKKVHSVYSKKQN